MTVQPVNDRTTPIGEILKAAGSEGIVLETEDQGSFVVIPLDDDVIDFLLERNPNFIASCREIRARVDAGQFHTHDEVRKLLAGE
jgi:hypothetical protein